MILILLLFCFAPMMLALLAAVAVAASGLPQPQPTWKSAAWIVGVPYALFFLLFGRGMIAMAFDMFLAVLP